MTAPRLFESCTPSPCTRGRSSGTKKPCSSPRSPRARSQDLLQSNHALFSCGRSNARAPTERREIVIVNERISASWNIIMEFFFKIGTRRTESKLDKWFEQLREDGRKLGVEVEPLTVCERICLEHNPRWMALSGRNLMRDSMVNSSEHGMIWTISP